MKKVLVSVQMRFQQEYEIEISDDDFEILYNGEGTYGNDPEIDVVHKAFERLRHDIGMTNDDVYYDSDYAIHDENGNLIEDWSD